MTAVARGTRAGRALGRPAASRSTGRRERRTGQLHIVFLGLSVTSSWGNAHASTYRALVRALGERGHDVLFLERDLSWYAANRDLPQLPHGGVELYDSLAELHRFAPALRRADLTIVGSYVPQGIEVCEWVLETAGGACAFYDGDTAVTVASLDRGACAYVSAELLPRFDLYLSSTGGPLLARVERDYAARRARPFYCLVDEGDYCPVDVEPRWDLGYLGTFGRERSDRIEELLLEPARQLPELQFVLGGPGNDDGAYPANVARLEHLLLGKNPVFYCEQRFSLNLARDSAADAGWSPTAELFEAAACGVPVVSDAWDGLDAFFEPGREILVATSADDVVRLLTEVGERERRAIGSRGRRRVLAEHTARRRAVQLERELRAVRAAA